MEEITTIGVDIAKRIFSVYWVDAGIVGRSGQRR